MILSTPFPLLSKATRSALLSNLNVAVTHAWNHSPQCTVSKQKHRARSISVIARALGLCPPTSSLATALSLLHMPPVQNSLPLLLEDTANRYISYLVTCPPPIDQSGIKVNTWNVTALSPLQKDYKNRIISNFAAQGIVCLQETKMTLEDARLLQLQIPGCLVLSSPCIHLEGKNSREETCSSSRSCSAVPETHDETSPTQTNSSGGVAILLPTYLCTTTVACHELVPGYAVAASFAMKAFSWCVVSFYLRPKHEKQILSQLTAELRKLIVSHSYETFLLLGDFNQAKKLPEWDVLLGAIDVVEVLPHNTNTYVGPNGQSALDTCLASSALFDDSLWTSRFKVIQRQDHKYGHNLVSLNLRPASRQTDLKHPAYQRIPNSVFSGTTPQRRVLPDLCQLFAPPCPCPKEWLEQTHAFFLAYSRLTPLPTKQTLAHSLKKQSTLAKPESRYTRTCS